MKIEEAIILIVKKGKEFLLLKRAKKPNKGILEFPSGKVERKNSSVEHAAWRGLQEKTGLYPSKLEYLGVFERREGDKILLFHAFLVKKFVGNIKLSREHDKFYWLSKKEILKRESSNEMSGNTTTILKKF